MWRSTSGFDGRCLVPCKRCWGTGRGFVAVDAVAHDPRGGWLGSRCGVCRGDGREHELGGEG